MLNPMKKIITIVAILATASCTESVMQPQTVPTAGSLNATSSTQTATLKGNDSTIPAYYDAVIHTIHFVEFPPLAEMTLIAHNGSLNFIYQSDPGLPGNQPFISVIDAIPGPGMNPLWREVQIVFNTGFTPHQLFSDDEIRAAAAGPTPEITLSMTNEVYQCPVVGHK
jgi:hypothetical protein